MSHFTMPVHWYMNAPLRTIPLTCTLNALHHRFIKYSISSMPVVDRSEALIGVVSRTDLIRQSFARRESDTEAPLLRIPQLTAADIMSPGAITVDSQDTLEEAAEVMAVEQIHRVYVTESGHLVGVLSARDVMPAVVDLQVTKPIGHFMSTPLFVVPSDETIANVTAFLETIHVSGVVVIGEAGALGVFTQAEALQCRNLPRATPVRDAMDTEILTVKEGTPLHLVAEEAVKLSTWRVVATDVTGVRGIVTPLDIVRAIAKDRRPAR
ncbi:MAG: CBS domain-containing protein [Proteobacteria bacterium]|nr:CBS domain-containing protein [Pseudomonadota bacterium]